MTPHSPMTPHPPMTPRSPMTPHSPMKSCLSMAPTSLTAPPSTSPSGPVDSPTDLKFRFESSSSHGSTSNETDESEANCPRYSYSVSPSPQDVSDTVVVLVTDVCTLRCRDNILVQMQGILGRARASGKLPHGWVRVGIQLRKYCCSVLSLKPFDSLVWGSLRLAPISITIVQGKSA